MADLQRIEVALSAAINSTGSPTQSLDKMRAAAWDLSVALLEAGVLERIESKENRYYYDDAFDVVVIESLADGDRQQIRPPAAYSGVAQQAIKTFVQDVLRWFEDQLNRTSST